MHHGWQWAARTHRAPLDNMAPQTTRPWLKFVLLEGKTLDDNILNDCAALFTKHYGVWGSEAPAPLNAGMTTSVLKANILASD